MLPIILLAAATAAAAPAPCAGVKNPPLCRDLMDVYNKDQAARAKGVKPTDAKKMDAANLIRVQVIINQFGWPGKALVGEKASGAAWTVLSHADADTQKMYVDLMGRAVDDKQLSPALYAQTVDRLAVKDGRGQVYGTQENAPVDDEEHVNDRRAKIGLPPLKKN